MHLETFVKSILYFKMLGNEKRFRFRQLCAELLTIELEGDFKNKIFPSLDQATLISVVKKYEKTISQKKLKHFKGNLDFFSRKLDLFANWF